MNNQNNCITCPELSIKNGSNCDCLDGYYYDENFDILGMYL